MQAALMELFRKPNWREDLSRSLQGGLSNEVSQLERVKAKMQFLSYSKRRMMDNYTKYMDQWIANARQPYAAKPPGPSVPPDSISLILTPYYSPQWYGDTDNQTQNALLTVTLALRAYRLEHGVYPTILAELVPSYLKKVPNDPFALQGALRYQRTKEKYVLYSVGPDGKDDGGKPIENPSADPESRMRYMVYLNSKGDVVAGVNQ